MKINEKESRVGPFLKKLSDVKKLVLPNWAPLNHRPKRVFVFTRY